MGEPCGPLCLPILDPLTPLASGPLPIIGPSSRRTVAWWPPDQPRVPSSYPRQGRPAPPPDRRTLTDAPGDCVPRDIVLFLMEKSGWEVRCPTSPPTGGEARQAVPSTSPDGVSQRPAPVLLPLSPGDSPPPDVSPPPSSLPPQLLFLWKFCSFCPSDLQSTEHLL